ncbi:MAG TPA: hypothetical protein VET85_08420 [Stellaceae bacterium]|nr:hypothetical protein [Stellaceae bacterium]
MGVVVVKYKEDCGVTVGAQPDQPTQPIGNPKKVGKTNTPFIMADGLHCFSLDTATPFTPLWQTGQVSEAAVLNLAFT